MGSTEVIFLIAKASGSEHLHLHLLSLKDKMIHLLSNTWFTLPVRRMGDRDQRHKGREMFFGLVLAGLNILGTSVATTVVFSQGAPSKKQVLIIIASLSFLRSSSTSRAAASCSFSRRHSTLGDSWARRGRATAGGNFKGPRKGLWQSRPSGTR